MSELWRGTHYFRIITANENYHPFTEQNAASLSLTSFTLYNRGNRLHASVFLVSSFTDSNFQFLLRQAFAVDKASTKLPQILLFLLLSTASLMFIPCAVRSSFTLSIHFFGFLPLLLVPSTCPYSATD